jgi:importin-4
LHYAFISLKITSRFTLPSSPLPLPEQLEQALTDMGVPDTDVVKRATAILKNFLRKPQAVMPMVQAIKSSANPQVRQMAAVLLRSVIVKRWKKMSDEQRKAVQNTLLGVVGSEKVRPVRYNVAALVASIARVTVPLGHWDGLIPFLFNALEKSPNTDHREVSIMLFRALAESIGKQLSQHASMLRRALLKGLQDPESRVRLEAIKAMYALVEQLSSVESKQDLDELQACVLPLLQIVQSSVDDDSQDDIVSAAFGFLEYLSESDVPVMSRHVTDVVRFMFSTIMQTRLDLTLRNSALDFLISFTSNKFKKIVKFNLVEPMLKCCVSLANEPFDPSRTTETVTPQRMSIDLCDALVSALPKDTVYNPLMMRASQLTRSNSPFERRGGLVIVYALVPECNDYVREELDKILGIVTPCLSDTSIPVYHAALSTLGVLCDYIAPEIFKHLGQILQTLFKELRNDSSPVYVKRAAIKVMESISDNVTDEEIKPFIGQYTDMLFSLVNQSNLELAAPAMCSLAQLVSSVGPNFMPYADRTLSLVKNLLQREEDELLDMRAYATECAGALALVVGKEKFKTVLPQVMKAVIGGMELGYHLLNEHAFRFFGHLAGSLEADMEPLLPAVIPIVLATLLMDEGVTVTNDAGLLSSNNHFDLTDSEDDDDDEFNTHQGMSHYSIESGALHEKMAALDCLADLVQRCPGGIVLYLQRTLKALNELIMYPHPDLRKPAVIVFKEIMRVVQSAFAPAKKPVDGEVVPLRDNAATIAPMVCREILHMLKQERYKRVCKEGLLLLDENIRAFGLGLFAEEELRNDLFNMLMTFLSESAVCQKLGHDDEDVEQLEHDEVVMDAVCEIVVALATVGAEKTMPLMQQVMPQLVRLCAPDRHVFDRSMAIGCIAEIAGALKARFAPFAPKVLEMLGKLVHSDELAVVRNSMFCLGSVIMATPKDASKHVAKFAGALERAITRPIDDTKYVKYDYDAARDNAVSTFAKIFVAYGDKCPLPKLVPTFLKGMPITADYEEAKYVYQGLLFLFAKHSTVMAPHIPRVVAILSIALGDQQIDRSLREQLLRLAKTLKGQASEQMMKVVAELPDQQRVMITKCMEHGLPPDSK